MCLREATCAWARSVRAAGPERLLWLPVSVAQTIPANILYGQSNHEKYDFRKIAHLIQNLN